MTMKLGIKLVAAAGLAVSMLPLAALAAGDAPVVERQGWSFGGMMGRFDKAQLQRGFQVYQDACAQCHALSRINFRNLVQPGGPGFPEEAVKALAAKSKVDDGPDDQGKMFKRPGRLSDKMPSPYKNEQEARSVHNGAYPPDLSLITKARGLEYHGSLLAHPFHLLWDVVTGYQEAGADYVHAILTGYADAPAGVKLADGMQYNKAFPGHQIAMPPPLTAGGVKYQDGTSTSVEQMSRDVVAFLSWAGDPKLEERKRMGLLVMLYMLITSILLYAAKKRIWAKSH